MTTTTIARIMHVLSYFMWVLFPLVLLTAWVGTLPGVFADVVKVTLKSHRDLKDQILLWYLKNY